MKIGIITDPVDFKSSGIGNYTYNLVEKLLEIDKENEYILIHLKKKEGRIYSKTKEIIVPPFTLPPKATIRKNLILPRRLNEEKLDVVHEPSQITPFIFYRPQIGTYASHIQPVYNSEDKCPKLLEIFNRSLALPMYYMLKEEDIDMAAGQLKEALEELK